MFGKPYNSWPLKIVAGTIGLLLALGVLIPNGIWQNWRLKPIHLLADLKQKSSVSSPSTYKGTRAELKQIVADTIKANPLVKKLVKNYIPIEKPDSTGQRAGLYFFNQAIHKLKKQQLAKVRIGYFGDSMIEGDLITQTIRKILQNKYGGDGVGFIPITSIVADYRQTVRAKANTNWLDVNYTNNKNKKIIGISGHTFYALHNAEMELKPGYGKHQNKLYNVNVLVGNTQNQEIKFTANGISYSFKNNNHFGVVKLEQANNNQHQIKFNFNESDIPLYGITSENDNGIILDNLSFRGTSGTEMLRLNSKMLKQIDSIRPYQLIVLHYGPNLLYADSIVNFSYYKKQLLNTVKYLKKCFPTTSILIISTADKAFKIDGEYQTGLGVEQLVAAQQEVAIKTGSAFFNLYEAMGGFNSMKTWTEKKPVLAGADYTHFNISGSAKIGRLIANALLNDYEKEYPAN